MASNEYNEILKMINIIKLSIEDDQNVEWTSNLKKAYKEKKLVLVLGAGISTEHGLPSWDILLQKLLFNELASNSGPNDSQQKSLVLAKIFTKLFSPSPLIAAKYLKNQYNERARPCETNSDSAFHGSIDQTSFEQAVRKVIYDGIKIGTQSELFKEVRQFCISSRNGSLDSIITYNYDNILEGYLSHSDIEIPYKSIFSSAIKHNDIEIPIYHVHGFLPQENELCSDYIILSEDLYHQQYKDALNWNNFIQINKFMNLTCLFIGVSFTDPNLRRLMDTAKNLKGESAIQHYIIRKRYNFEETRDKLQTLLKTDKELLEEKSIAGLGFDETVKKLIDLMQDFQKNDAASFNVGTIWVDNYTDIPSILKQIRT